MIDTQTSPSETGFWWRFFPICLSMTERDRHNMRRANWWLAGWMASFVGVLGLIRFHLLDAVGFVWLAIAASTGLGALAVHSYVQFLGGADELVRKIHLEALALGFATGLMGSFTFALIEQLTQYHFDLGDVVLALMAGYLVGIWTGARRYR